MGQEHTYRYESKFTFVDYKEKYPVCVSDPEAAQAWLGKQSLYMAESLQERIGNDPRCKTDFSQNIQSVNWALDDNRTGEPFQAWAADSGTISVETDRELTEDELGYVSAWVRGQARNELGEAFILQPFADCGHENGRVTNPEPYGMNAIASFETMENDFELKLAEDPSLELTETDLDFVKQAAPQM